MQSVSSCPLCKSLFDHNSASTSTEGYYAVNCNNGHRLLKCAHTSCTYVVEQRRAYDMRRHQLNKHTKDDTDYDDATDVLFDNDNQMLADNNEDTAEDITNSTPPNTNNELDMQISNAINNYNIPSDIINDNPYISLLFQDENDDYNEMDDIVRDEQVMEELFLEPNLDNTVRSNNCDVVDNNDDATTMNLSQFEEVMNGTNNARFFCQQHLHRNGGIRDIIQRANDGSFSTPDITNIASEEETRFMFNALDNMLGKTPTEREMYLQTIPSLLALTKGFKDCVKIEIPTDIKSANRLVLSSKHSSFANLPCEDVFEIDGHVCISASDKLNTILARGTELAYWQDHSGRTNFEGFNGTPIGRAQFEYAKANLVNGKVEQTCFGHIMTWSDAFQPRWSRQRDKSIWLYVMRVCAPPGHSTSEDHTFCLAFGSAKLPHDKVVEHYQRELMTFVDGFRRYDGKAKAIVNTSFVHAAYLADTPERNAILHLLNGGLYGKRSGHATKIDPKRLPSCDRCFWVAVDIAHHMSSPLSIDEQPTRRVCNQCCQFNHFTDSTAKKFDATEDTDYPIICSQESGLIMPQGRTIGISHILCVKQTFPWLIQGVKVAYYEHSQGRWPYQKTVKAYLAALGVNEGIIKRVIAAAKRYKEGEDVSEDEYIPMLWKLKCDIEMFIEASMHLLGHGIMGSIIDLTEAVFKENNIWTDFMNFANPILKEVAACRLSWCKIQTLPKKNWLAEDEFGFCRLMMSLYGRYIEEKKLDVKFQGMALGAALTSLKQLLCSCQVMISLLMCKKEVSLEKIDVHIKIFLDCCHRFCGEYYGSTVTEFWFSKINFVSLLNLTEQISKYGHIGLTWEGVFERFIQIVKPTLQTARMNTSSLKRKMILIQKQSNMRYIRDALFPEMKKEKANRYQGGVRFYPSKGDILSCVANGLPVSCFYNKRIKDRVMVAYSVGRDMFKYVRLAYDIQSANSCGLCYAKFTLDAVQSDTKYHKSKLASAGKVDDIATQFCLLLPYQSSSTFASMFSLVTHEWLVLCVDGNITDAMLCKVLFAKDKE